MSQELPKTCEARVEHEIGQIAQESESHLCNWVAGAGAIGVGAAGLLFGPGTAIAGAGIGAAVTKGFCELSSNVARPDPDKDKMILECLSEELGKLPPPPAPPAEPAKQRQQVNGPHTTYKVL